MKQCDLCMIVGEDWTELITNETIEGAEELGEIEICHLCRSLVKHCLEGNK